MRRAAMSESSGSWPRVAAWMVVIGFSAATQASPGSGGIDTDFALSLLPEAVETQLGHRPLSIPVKWSPLAWDREKREMTSVKPYGGLFKAASDHWKKVISGFGSRDAIVVNALSRNFEHLVDEAISSMHLAASNPAGLLKLNEMSPVARKVRDGLLGLRLFTNANGLALAVVGTVRGDGGRSVDADIISLVLDQQLQRKSPLKRRGTPEPRLSNTYLRYTKDIGFRVACQTEIVSPKANELFKLVEYQVLNSVEKDAYRGASPHSNVRESWLRGPGQKDFTLKKVQIQHDYKGRWKPVRLEHNRRLGNESG